MPDKPGSIATWASDGGDHIVVPSSGKKATGFLGGEQPPAEFLNWLGNLAGLWQAYLNSPNNITLGEDIKDTEAHARLPRITVDPAPAASGALLTMVAKFGDARVWMGNGTTQLALVLTYNALLGAASTWTKITNSQPATAFYLFRDRLVYASMPAAQNTAWANAIFEGEGSSGNGWGQTLNLPADSAKDTLAQSDVARFHQQVGSVTGVERLLLFRFQHATLGDVRLYYSIDATNTDAAGLEITTNAAWDNTGNLWMHDVTGTCIKFTLSPKRFGVKFRRSETAVATFDDTQWDTSPVNFAWQTTNTTGAGDENKYDLGNGRIRFIGTGSAQADDANPPATAAVPANAMPVKGFAKAWGKIEEQTTGPLITEGLNIASVTHDGGAAESITITFATAMQNADYAVTITPVRMAGGNFILPNVVSQTTAGFVVTFLKFAVAGANARVDIGVDEFFFFFDVHARQDS